MTANDPETRPLRLDEFPPPTREEWRASVDADRRSPPYDDLLWHTDDGIDVPPLFTRQDLAGLPHLAAYARVARAGGWAIRERIAAASPELAATQARAAAAADVDELELRIDVHPLDAEGDTYDAPELCGIPIRDQGDMSTVLDAIDLSRTALSFDGALCFDATVPLAFTLVHAEKNGIDPATLRGELGFDPIEGLEQLDEHAREELRWRKAGQLLAHCAEHCPGMRALAVRSRWCHEIGATPSQEIALTLAEAVEIIRQLGERGHAFDTVAAGLTFRLPVSTHLGTEIAKLRALRLLWAKVTHAFTGGAGEVGAAVPIVAYSSEHTRSREFDLHTNLLRGTLEAMAGALAGCDAVCLLPYDPHPDYQDDEARTLARHQHHLLRAEGFVDRVADPTAGSYALEALTDEIGRRAWEHFQQIEAAGGMLEALRSGAIMQVLLEAASARAGRVRRREDVLIGISRFVDPKLEGVRRRHVDRAELVRAFDPRGAAGPAAEAARSAVVAATHDATASLIAATVDAARAGCSGAEILAALDPVEMAADGDEAESFVDSLQPEDVAPELLVADADNFEDLRDWLRREGPPQASVVQAVPGRLAHARVEWIADLLRAGGFDVAVESPFESAAAAAQVVAKRAPELAVLCADDDSYPEVAAALASALGASRRRVPITALAGPPQPELIGRVDAFLYNGADVLLRLEYLFRRVERQRLERSGAPPDEEIRESLDTTLELIAELIGQEDRGDES